MSIRNTLPRLIKDFKTSTAASVAMTMGLAALPVMMITGMAIDYVHASQVQASLQAAVDNATLAAGKAEDMTDAQLNKLVREYLKRNHAEDELDALDSVKIVRDGDKSVQVIAKGKVNTTLMSLAGFKTMDVAAETIVRNSFGNLEVALVLDNTWSMSPAGKMSALKSSAHKMVDELFDKKGSGTDLKMSLVPFAQYVNIGMGNRNASWADIPADRDIPRSYPGYWYRPVTRYYNCTTRTGTGVRDGVPYTYTYNVCDKDYGPRTWHPGGSWTQHIRWKGCVGSRNDPYNSLDTDPSRRIPGLMNNQAKCPRPITTLTDSKTAIKSEIDNMTASGNQTYIPAGLMWGWRTLSSQAPFSDGVTKPVMKNKNYTKAIVLMTDGSNTRAKSSGSALHNDHSVNDANKLTAKICRNIKADGVTEKERIKIYTVTFKVTDSKIKNLMQDCATNSSYYFDADDGAALAKAFEEIADSLITLYISK